MHKRDMWQRSRRVKLPGLAVVVQTDLDELRGGILSLDGSLDAVEARLEFFASVAPVFGEQSDDGLVLVDKSSSTQSSVRNNSNCSS